MYSEKNCLDTPLDSLTSILNLWIFCFIANGLWVFTNEHFGAIHTVHIYLIEDRIRIHLIQVIFKFFFKPKRIRCHQFYFYYCPCICIYRLSLSLRVSSLSFGSFQKKRRYRSDFRFISEIPLHHQQQIAHPLLSHFIFNGTVILTRQSRARRKKKESTIGFSQFYTIYIMIYLRCGIGFVSKMRLVFVK